MENDLSTSDGSLKDILNSVYYLEKILGYLVNHGIYECSLVCRKWYAVCSRLPVKLVLVPMQTLPVVVDRFPNAVSLSFCRNIEWNDETAGAIQSLARLERLEEIKFYELFLDRMKASNALAFCTLLGEALQSCHQLHSLSIGTPNNVEAGDSMSLYSHISHLTGLTCLHLPGGWEQLVNDPYTDVRNIEDLEIESVCLEDGQLVFPSLTHLTRLRTRMDVDQAEKFKGGFLQVKCKLASNSSRIVSR